MRIFALSDIHIDYQENRDWLFDLSSMDFKEDILILAGDVTDSLKLLRQCFLKLSAIFRKVLYIPGNHDLWIVRERFLSSFEKYDRICDIAGDCDILMTPYHLRTLSIVPLLGWYDFSFGSPNAQLIDTWMDFRNCDWSEQLNLRAVCAFFLEKNTDALKTINRTVISFSHFMPRLDLIPNFVPASWHYLNPVMGSTLIEAQIRRLRPQIHIFGHRHFNCQTHIDGILYINNAFGYPCEQSITNKKLLCIFNL